MNATATAAADTSAPQHLKALERANKVRLARAELKRQVASGALPAAEVVLSSPWQAESMTLSDLLMSQRRWGRTRCRKLLVSIPVSENKQIGTMTERQRLAVAAALSPSSNGARPTARLSNAITATGRLAAV